MKNFSSWSIPNSEHFPSPFADYASTFMPDSIQDSHNYCEYIMDNHGVYKSAIKRVLSYFVTEVNIGDDKTAAEDKDKYTTLLNEIDIKKCLLDIGMNLITYGNVFVSVTAPFHRFLSCPRCGCSVPFKEFTSDENHKFKWRNYQFTGKCTANNARGEECAFHGAWNVQDIRRAADSKLQLKIWAPQEIEIKFEELHGNREFYWKIPESYKTQVKEGDLLTLEFADTEVIEAVKRDRRLRFDAGVILHFYESPLAGRKTAGWGISSLLANFRQAWYVQIVHRYNEQIALDYIMPCRVITPDNKSGELGDSSLGTDNRNLMYQVRRMIRKRRLNPTEWFTLPYPIRYMLLGGEAKQLAPYELLDQGVSLLLNNIGVPVEYYKGTITAEGSKVALRLLETYWTYLTQGLNKFLEQFGTKAVALLRLRKTPLVLARPTVLDDIQDQMNKLQLMTGGVVSQTTGLKGMNLEFEVEAKRKIEEQKILQELTAKAQEDMEQAAAMEQMGAIAPPQAGPAGPGVPGAPAAPGAAGAPAAPAGPAGVAAQSHQLSTPSSNFTPQTPDKVLEKANLKSEEIMGMNPSQRRSALIELKNSDPLIHGIVKEMIRDKEYQTRRDAGNQVLAQQKGP